ncbi:heme/hemin ABC transporter substrate-binding protein [Arthrobacter sp. TMT4-20]
MRHQPYYRRARNWAHSPTLAGFRLLAAILAVTVLVSGCGADIEEASGQTGRAFEDAVVLEDPKSHQGPSTALLSDPALVPLSNPQDEILPATIIDSQGIEVTIHDTSRILAVDLYGTTARTVFELGLGDNVVGRDVSSSFPEIADLPLVTQNGHELNAEAILQLAPTVIITDSSLGPWNAVLQMRDAGIPVVVVDSHRSMENVGPLIEQVAAALGVPDDGARLANKTNADIADMTAAIAEITPAEGEKLRMVFLYVRGQSGIYYLFGPGSGTDSLISSLGGVDVAAEIGWEGMQPMTDEALVAAQPDVVLVMTKGLESVDGVDGLLVSVPSLAQTPAGQNRRIVDMADNDVLSFGPKTASVLEALSVAIYAPDTAAVVETP